MEAFLLTLDIAAMVWLCWLVRKVISGKEGGALGWFGYRDTAQTDPIVRTTTTRTKGTSRA